MSSRTPAHASLGRAIRTRRLALGLSQEGLAADAGLDRTYIGGVERGERNPSLSSLLKIAGALDSPLADLVAEL